MEINKQKAIWEGQFGKDYTERNLISKESLASYHLKTYGISRAEMFKKILADVPKDARILEVGSNVGFQLIELQNLGFKNLYGIDLSEYAVEKSKSISKNINIIKSSGYENPFNSNYFDLVFTCGVLVNIASENLEIIMREMLRVSEKYILGAEYYAEELTTIPYRLDEDFLWKADYAQIFLDKFSNLKLIQKDIYEYKDGSGNRDALYLLEKIK